MVKIVYSSAYNDVVKNAPDNERGWFDVAKDVDKYWYEIDGKCEKLQKDICDEFVTLLLSDYYVDGYTLMNDVESNLVSSFCYGSSESRCKNILDELNKSKNEVYNWVGSMLYDQTDLDDSEFEDFFNGLSYSYILQHAISGMIYILPNYFISDEKLNNDFHIENLTEEQNSQLIDEIEEYKTYLD